MAARIEMMTTTIMSSTSVKPRAAPCLEVFFPTIGSSSDAAERSSGPHGPTRSSTQEERHHLDVVGLGHEIERHRAREAKPAAREALRVPRQRLRIARHVDELPACEAREHEVAIVEPLPWR